MKQAIHQILSLLVVILIAITCTEEPAGPDISDDLKPKGTITGWVYDAWNRPIKDVLVSVDADSSVACVSDATGLFRVGRLRREHTYFVLPTGTTKTIPPARSPSLWGLMTRLTRRCSFRMRIILSGASLV